MKQLQQQYTHTHEHTHTRTHATMAALACSLSSIFASTHACCIAWERTLTSVPTGRVKTVELRCPPTFCQTRTGRCCRHGVTRAPTLQYSIASRQRQKLCRTAGREQGEQSMRRDMRARNAVLSVMVNGVGSMSGTTVCMESVVVLCARSVGGDQEVGTTWYGARHGMLHE